MADDLKQNEDTSLIEDPKPQQPLAKVQGVPWLIVILLIALASWLAFKAFGPDDSIGDPLATSLIAFEQQNQLNVFSAQLAPVVSSEDSRFFGTVKTRQVAVIPATVNYSIDLSRMDARRMKWDGEANTLDIQLPPVRVATPNLDEARAQYLREGVWITREAQDKMTRDNTKLAEEQAMHQAASPVLMKLARDAGRTAVTQNLAIPLQVAGFGDVEVTVRYDDDPPAKPAVPAAK